VNKKIWLAALVCSCSVSAVQAQDEGFSVSVGTRAWYTSWTTFSYFTDGAGNNLALTQASADDKLVLVPVVSTRWGDFVGSVSIFPSTRVSFVDGSTGARKEWDVNLGYAVLPGLNLTLGYKKMSQRDDNGTCYEPGGLLAGVSGNAQISGPYSLYGSFGYGRLKTPKTGCKNVVAFTSDYRITELGLAYTLPTDGMPKRWTFTGGYRMQVMGSNEAFTSPGTEKTQSGRDTTQGFTFGAIATF
jgi:hypothetical protein